MNFPQDRNIFYWHNWIPHPQKHIHRHQFCDSNCLRTQATAQNVISRFRRRPFWKWPKTGSPSQFFFDGIDFWYRGRSKEQKNLVLDCPGGGGVHGNPIWPMDYSCQFRVYIIRVVIIHSLPEIRVNLWYRCSKCMMPDLESNSFLFFKILHI